MKQSEERHQEEQYLEKTLALAEKQLQQAQERAGKKQQEILEAKREAYEYASYGRESLSDVHDFEALVELSQYVAPITEGIADYEETKRTIDRLEQFLKRPYFARLDFQFEGEEEAERIYIGRSSLVEKPGMKWYVYDWRSPIASVFYRFMTGPAFYTVPIKHKAAEYTQMEEQVESASRGRGLVRRIEGNVLLKRQYEIKNGKLEFYFDSDRNIEDEMLRQLLSQNASPKMKAIVETIQSDQDSIIRDMEHELLMVQGVAGSGKTSIALHRAAYLMYQGLQTRLDAASILILSPNTAFEEYISQVLPELGEEQIGTAVFEELLGRILKGKQIQPRQEVLELLLSHRPKRELIKASIELKLSREFQAVLDQLLLDLPTKWIAFQDLYVRDNSLDRERGFGKREFREDELREHEPEDTDIEMERDSENAAVQSRRRCLITGEKLREQFTKRPELPLRMRLEHLEEYVSELAFGTEQRHQDTEERNRLRQELQQSIQLDAVLWYEKLYTDFDYFNQLLEAGRRQVQEVQEEKIEEMPDKLYEIWSYTKKSLQSGRLSYDDAVAAAYLALKIEGRSEYQEMKQVVIDEAQDYESLPYEILGLLFPKARFTVLGDIHQTLTRQEDMSLYERIRRGLKKKNTCLLSLDKSFRCTSEILQFGLQFITHRPEIKSFNRSGETPTVIPVKDHAERLTAIRREAESYQKQGFGTICLLCKNRKTAARFLEDLSGQLPVRLPDEKEMEKESLQGMFLLPIYLAKGLEFDAVILCDVSSQNYGEEEKGLLYIACTRALHRLSMICDRTFIG